MEVVLGMPFFSLSNADVKFAELANLIQRSYIASKALPISSWIELINKKEFAKEALDESFEMFVVKMAALEAEVLIYLLRTAQIANL